MRAWSGQEVDLMGASVRRTSSEKLSNNELKNGNDLAGTGYLVAVGSRSARFRRKYQSRIVIVLLILLVVILTIMLIVVSCLYSKSKKHKTEVICNSRECLRSAASLALSMDPSVDPCEDFYQYVCGNWEESHPMPDTALSYDWFYDKQKKIHRNVREVLTRNYTTSQPKPVKQAIDMYDACMDIEKLDDLRFGPIRDILRTLGLPQYPTYLNVTSAFDYATYSFDWLQAVINIKTYLAMDVLIGFDVITDPKNASVFRLIMGTPETTQPLPTINSDIEKYLDKMKRRPRKNRRTSSIHPILQDDYVNMEEYFAGNAFVDSEEEDGGSVNEKFYKLYVAEVTKAMFVESDGPKLTQMVDSEIDENILRATDKYVELSHTIYLISDDDSDDGNTTEDDMLFEIDMPDYTADEIQRQTDHVSELNNVTGALTWRPYLEQIFEISNVTLDFDEDRILVSDPDLKYLSLLSALLAKTSTASIELYIWIQVVETLILHTTSDMRELHERYSKKVTGAESSQPRSLHCAGGVNELMGMAVSYNIVDHHFINETKPKVELMLGNLKTTLGTLVEKSRWMDGPTKSATLEKIQRMKSFIGFPEWLLEEGKLEEFYEGIEVSVDTHLMNMVGVIQWRLVRKLNKFRDINEFMWASDPTEVNAYHTFQANAITVPIVMLQYPFYDLGLEALNYGAVGTILGHEITHGFDNIGRQYDKNGNMLQWWTNATIDSFVRQAACFIDQYSTYYVPEVDKYVNGKQTLGENIADNGGVREAIGAYKSYLEQKGPEPKLAGFETFSHEQLFFMSYANLWCSINTKESLKWDLKDEHSPSPIRLRGVLQNSAEFASAWNCRKNSTMNPSRSSCVIF